MVLGKFLVQLIMVAIVGHTIRSAQRCGTTWTLIPNVARRNRIDPRGPSCGQPHGRERDGTQHGRNGRKNNGIVRSDAEQKALQEPRQTEGSTHAE